MGEVAIDLEHELRAGRERDPKTGDVRAAEPVLPFAVQHVHVGQLAREPIRDLPGAVRRGVIDDQHAVVRPEHLAERAHHRLDVVALVVGRQADGGPHLPIIAVSGIDSAEKRRDRGPARAARRPERARERGVLQGARLPSRRDENPRDRRPRRPVGARGQGEEPRGDRQDDRGEDRRGGRDRGDGRAYAAQGDRPGRGRQVHAPSRSRPEDGPPDLEGARRDDARGAESGRGAGAPAGARRTRGEERGEDPQGARRGATGSARVAPPAWRWTAGRACGRRGSARPSRRGQGLRGRLRAPPPRDVPRPRRDRDLDRRARASRALHEDALGCKRGSQGRHEGDRDRERRPSLRPARRPAGVVRQSPAALHRLEGPQRRPARGRSSPRPVGLGVLRHEHGDGRGVHGCGRGRALCPPRLRVHPTGVAREQR